LQFAEGAGQQHANAEGVTVALSRLAEYFEANREHVLSAFGK
jgi:hypothetical protein